jgi:pilus assembly protein CpaF
MSTPPATNPLTSSEANLGPLEPLLKDPTISDILVNGAKEVYIERAGVLEESGVVFTDNAHLMRIIE